MRDDTTKNPITDDIVKTATQAAPKATPAIYHPPADGSAQPEAIPVQARGGFRVLFVAIDGCGSTTHNFRNIGALARTGIAVEYINANSFPESDPINNPGPPAGARQINRSFDEGARMLRNYGLSAFSSAVLLIGPNGRVVDQFDSRDRDFVNQVQQRIQQEQGQRQRLR